MATFGVVSRYSILALMLIFQVACSTPPPRPTDLALGDYRYVRDYSRWMISKTLAENKIVGLSIALIDDQQVVLAEGFGWADREREIKAAPETVYRVGSITKLFTATAAMQLAERGRLDINSPLQRAVPEFSIRSRFKGMVTPRNIMTHHSGLPSNYVNGMWTPDSAPFTQLAGTLGNEYLAHPPDTVHMYSNLGFSLLGHAVQAVSGQAYSDYIQQALLAPMGMSHSYIAASLNEGNDSARAYSQGEQVEPVPLRDLPAGALNSSALDMARFAQMVFADGSSGGHRVLRPTTLADMLRFQDGDAPFDVQPTMGLGWFLSRRLGEDAGLVASHGGSTVLYNSMLMLLPKHKLGVVVLTNSDTGFGTDEKIAIEIIRQALRAKTGIRALDDDEPDEDSLPPDAEDTKALPGRYSTQMGIIEIESAGDGFKVRIEGEDEKLDLVRQENGRYRFSYKILGFMSVGLAGLEDVEISRAVMSGREVLLFHTDGFGMLAGEKIQPYKVRPVWRQRLGRYVPINDAGGMLLKSVDLRLEKGLLLMSVQAQWPYAHEAETSKLVLAPVNSRQATIHGLSLGTGDTVSFTERDGEVLMHASGYLLRREP